MKNMTRQEYVAHLRRFFFFFFGFMLLRCMPHPVCSLCHSTLLSYAGKAVDSLGGLQCTEEWQGPTSLVLCCIVIFALICLPFKKDEFFSPEISVSVLIYGRHHQHGRWQARIGRVAGNKDLYLGTFSEFSWILTRVSSMKYLIILLNGQSKICNCVTIFNL